MKKTTLILIIAIFMMFSKPVYANESVDSAEVVFRAMRTNIYKERSITSEAVNNSIEIIKKWPESIYASESIYTLHYPVVASHADEKVLINNSRWFEKNIINNKIAEIETAEVIVYTAMLYLPEQFTDYNYSMSYFPSVVHNKGETYEIASKYKRYELDFVKSKSIQVLKNIENYSNNENYKVLAFFVLLRYYCLTEDGIKHVKQFIEKYVKHPAIAEIRLYLSDKLLDENKFDMAVAELQKIIELYRKNIVSCNNFNYGTLCYDKLTQLYFEKKDYVNAKKYILLLKENAPADYPNLKEMEEKLNIIEKLIKK